MIQIQTDLSIMEVIEKTYQGEVVSDSIFGLTYIYSKYKLIHPMGQFQNTLRRQSQTKCSNFHSS